ncbi:TusE/DsrC/DsvC family sulfur relay protein [Balneolaceae bacterium YR4-1]|uniref:TusE/DsrC/DsvC family sulfur relay protein n=1 Tax=Halalkalibaculum roseum TaxID=2709311 RepID=A0A6M1T522_9BACT|nr:TusE/DsrC/DsvC family sulfur relay protein [Halalkalibaculum roseum]NGP75443.1 TusE/DsrC/DsvC family sulfur relay protein [Halalkalibaculum roseum]
MSTATLANKTLEIDAEGFLKDHTQWNKDIARELAEQEGIFELTDRHWTVIEFMRKEYEEKGDGPSIRKLTKESGVPTKELYQLFPKGPAKKAAKIAGIPKPTGCI